MSLAGEYRNKAAAMAEMAEREPNPKRRAELQNLERSYLRLALQADKNATANIGSGTPTARTPEAPVAQQQQRQPKKKPE